MPVIIKKKEEFNFFKFGKHGENSFSIINCFIFLKLILGKFSECEDFVNIQCMVKLIKGGFYIILGKF